MRLLLGTLLAFIIATFSGLGLTWVAVTRGAPFGGLVIGSWTAWPSSGTVDIDPYSHASMARIGALPVGLGDGLAFTARKDDGGKLLDGRCEVVIAGNTPQARYWTLAIYDREGNLIANSAQRLGFTSQELIRATDGTFEVTVGPRPRPGNWLPTSGVDSYVLVLRLYDTPVGVATRAGLDAPMPSIALKSCS